MFFPVGILFPLKTLENTVGFTGFDYNLMLKYILRKNLGELESCIKKHSKLEEDAPNGQIFLPQMSTERVISQSKEIMSPAIKQSHDVRLLPSPPQNKKIFFEYYLKKGTFKPGNFDTSDSLQEGRI